MHKSPSIALSGLTSCGKTYHAKKLRDMFDMQNVSASEILLDEGFKNKYHNVSVEQRNNHFWLKKMDIFNKQRIVTPDLDRIVDLEIVRRLLEVRNYVCETLTAGFLLKEHPETDSILKIYLQTSLQTRISRSYLSSDLLPISDLGPLVNEKDTFSREIIQNIWGIDIFNEEEIKNCHNIVLNTSAVDNNDPEDKENEQLGKNTIRKLLRAITYVYLYRCLGNIEYAAYMQNNLDVIAKIINQYPDLVVKLPNLYQHIEQKSSIRTKWDRGRALVLGGSPGTIFTVKNTAEASMKSGVGLTVACVKEDIRDTLEASSSNFKINTFKKFDLESAIEISALLSKSDCLSIGVGIEENPEELMVFLKEILFNLTKPLVIDADAIVSIAENKSVIYERSNKHIPIVLTMNKKETDIFYGTWTPNDSEVQKDAQIANAWIVLKGETTKIYSPEGDPIKLETNKTPEMATAGVGDILTGLIGGLIAQGYGIKSSILVAIKARTLAAQYYISKTGDVVANPIDIISHLPYIWNNPEILALKNLPNGESYKS
jgi:hydroxyethylthiazole kinase-like uncharacterized protein yjeF